MRQDGGHVTPITARNRSNLPDARINRRVPIITERVTSKQDRVNSVVIWWHKNAQNRAWFKNGQFRVTLDIFARTVIGPAAGADSPRTGVSLSQSPCG